MNRTNSPVPMDFIESPIRLQVFSLPRDFGDAVHDLHDYLEVFRAHTFIFFFLGHGCHGGLVSDGEEEQV